VSMATPLQSECIVTHLVQSDEEAIKLKTYHGSGGCERSQVHRELVFGATALQSQLHIDAASQTGSHRECGVDVR
jgi:hypothetical protein